MITRSPAPASPSPVSSTRTKPTEGKKSSKTISGDFESSFFFVRTVIAIAGDNFVVVGSDTRLVEEDDIVSRDHPKLYHLTPNIVLAATGNVCDVDELAEKLKTDAKLYLMNHNREISVDSMSQNLSAKMYAKRLFPYVVYPLICGLKDGKGYISSFDVIGHKIEHRHRVVGASETLIQAVLDSEIDCKHQKDARCVPMTVKRAINLISDQFICAAERCILTGDSMVVSVITEKGVDSHRMALRKD